LFDVNAEPVTRGVHLRALAAGLAVYLVLWLAAALFSGVPAVGAILRAIASAVTWVVVTLGLGAALLSRAGTRRAMDSAGSGDDLSWQTPTPVTGVSASTRRVSVTR
jgi:hypothetical protein